MDALLAACSKVTSYMSFDALPIGEHRVSNFFKTDSKYGQRVRVNVGEKYVYLPERFSCLTSNDLKQLNKTPTIMIYGGKDRSNQDRLKIDFKPIEDDSSNQQAENEE